jgi:hypothetical protein
LRRHALEKAIAEAPRRPRRPRIPRVRQASLDEEDG